MIDLSRWFNPQDCWPDYMQWYARVSHLYVQNPIHHPVTQPIACRRAAHTWTHLTRYLLSSTHIFMIYYFSLYNAHIHLLFKYNVLHVHWISLFLSSRGVVMSARGIHYVVRSIRLSRCWRLRRRCLPPLLPVPPLFPMISLLLMPRLLPVLLLLPMPNNNFFASTLSTSSREERESEREKTYFYFILWRGIIFV